ncbi:MAG: hypothetical protein KYX62_17405 [Pseudomonadota bacterium]|nr:hypothetical protein [Pseudomonadota bacterium]
MLRKITLIDNDIPQLFARIYKGPEQYDGDCRAESILEERRPSLLTLTHNGERVLKLIKPRTWHEYFKLFWFHSRVSKEIKGNRTLASIGLRTPTIYEAGISIFPARDFRYIGYYCMENLSSAGYQEVYRYYKSLDDNSELRARITENLIHDLLEMRRHSIVFSDLHLNNVFADEQGKICWIDTGIIKFRSDSSARFRKKYDQSVIRLLDFYRSEKVMTDQEKQLVRQQCLFSDQSGQK